MQNSNTHNGFTFIAYNYIFICEFTISSMAWLFEINIEYICPGII